MSDSLRVRLNATKFTVPKYAPSELVARAVKWYNKGIDNGVIYNAETTDASVLRRVQVNYLRHMETNYDVVIRQVRFLPHSQQLQDVIRERVFRAIAGAYPHLAGECLRQLQKKRKDVV